MINMIWLVCGDLWLFFYGIVPLESFISMNIYLSACIYCRKYLYKYETGSSPSKFTRNIFDQFVIYDYQNTWYFILKLVLLRELLIQNLVEENEHNCRREIKVTKSKYVQSKYTLPSKGQNPSPYHDEEEAEVSLIFLLSKSLKQWAI